MSAFRAGRTGTRTVKILYYANIHLKENDGPSGHVLAVCRELGRLGHRVVLFTHPCVEALVRGGFAAVRVPEWGGALGPGCKRLMWRMCGYLVVTIFRPDIVYQRDRADDMFPLSLSRRTGTPLVIEANGWSPQDAQLKHGDAAYERTIRMLHSRYQSASAVIASSPGVRDLVISAFGLSASKVVFVSNGVDLERFAPPAPYASNSAKFIVGFVCGYHPDLDIDTILRAFALFPGKPRSELHVVTYNAQVKEWRHKAAQLGIDGYVKFTHGLSQQQLPLALRDMDLCLAVYTSGYIRKMQSLEASLKLWEYWASQRPVVATDVPGSLSYHHHVEKRYWAVEPGDPKALADAISMLRDSPQLAKELAMNGYEYVREGHTWGDTARRIESVLEDVSKK